jgi:hypothetical protein
LLGADNLVTELNYSYSLIFSRDEESREIARKLFATRNLTPVFYNHDTDMRGQFPPGTVFIGEWDAFQLGETPMLRDFERYRGNFAFLQQQMEQWKPESIRDLLQPGYKDRFTWYATVFGGTIAFIGIIGVITGIISTATGIVSMNAALKALN